MGEALITSRTGTISGSNGSGNNGAGLLKTEIFKTSDVFIVPKAKNQSFSVRIFGGGGGGAYCRYYYNSSKSYAIMAGGGGGWMNNNVLILDEGQHVPISIGSGGNSSITIDGKAVFTAGSGGTTSFGTYISALGGEGGEIENYGSCKGGNGGSGGGAYGNYSLQWIYGGTGFQFGGGAGGSGGNGGKWGGGGATFYKSSSRVPLGGCLYENSQSTHSITGYSGLAGNGGNNRIYAENGTNTIGNDEVESYLQGAGIISCGNGWCAGGGGYGGCSDKYSGGGGYGANGGNNSGGGGGYGGKGGDGTPNGYTGAGGGGAYGDGGSLGSDGSFGGGGGAYGENAGNGGDGICIIQYYPE